MGFAARSARRTRLIGEISKMPTKPAALITGGAKGIGCAIARHLLSSGWQVGIIDLPDSGLRQAFSRQRGVLVIEGDVRNEETASDAVDAMVHRFRRLDAVVSNAGIMIRKPLRRLTLAEWHRVVDTNLTGAFLLARAAEKPLRRAHGAIVTIASTRALMSEPNTESYSASKGGLVALTHALAISLAPDVRVNCVSPGWIEAKDYAGLRRKDHRQHPAGRVGKPEDVAELVGWLLDAERSGFVTGANFVIDGGMTRKMIYEARKRRAERCASSDRHSFRGRVRLVLQITGIDRAGWLEAQNQRLLVGTGAMLDTARHDDAFSWLQAYHAILKLDAEPAAPDQEELVLVLVIVPGEFALNFHELDLLAVQSRDGLWTPMFGKQREFLVQADLVHRGGLILFFVLLYWV
jgi:NAD(P)-dependent dehydrogenase (short-subunit alcohol dehydrogenase family)